jgi:hypothetical protein
MRKESQMTEAGAATSILGQQGTGQQSQQSQYGQGGGQESLVAVPLSIFSGLLTQAGKWLGGQVGGQTGADIGGTAGGIIGSLLPFQVIPPARAAA